VTAGLTVIGVGNPWRSDDGAGLEVARRLEAAAPAGVRVLRQEGHQSGLLEQWRGADEVAVVDAASSGARPGTVHRFDTLDGPIPARMLRSSTHAFGVAEAVELGRALGRLPGALVVYAIEAGSLAIGAGLTPAVERAVERLVKRLAACEP
jgi:hydrogenase maturation protease